ncbi:MAG: SpoIIE family protein phosphatase [Bacteroidales bacterium]|nr:SpoIIE family protein phosphatase [Bacteroidales bacterium]
MRFLILLFIILPLLPLLANAQYNKRGSRLTRSYTFTRDKFEHRQFVMSAQDNRGIMYFANISKLAEYDGNDWRIIEGLDLPQTIACDPFDGRVYASSTEDFGYITADKSGKSVYVSLRDLLPDSTNVGVGFKLEFSEESVFFIGLSDVIEYHKATNTAEKVNIFGIAHDYFEGNLYGSFRGKSVGLEKRDTFEFTPYKLTGVGEILLELFRLDEDNILMTLGSNMKKYNEKTGSFTTVPIGDFSAKLGMSGQLDKIIRLKDNKFAISTRGAMPLGAYAITDSTFAVQEYLGSHSGLSENFATSSFLSEQDGLLWTTDLGISTINTNSPIRIISYPSEIQGSITWLEEGACLYAGTTDGMFRRTVGDEGFYQFKKMQQDNNTGVVYSMNSFTNPFTGEKGAIAFADGGIYIPVKGKSVCINNRYKSVGSQSSVDPTIIYCSSEYIIEEHRLSPDYKTKLINKYTLPVSAIPAAYGDDGQYLWCTTYDGNVYRVDTKANKTYTYDVSEGDKVFMADKRPIIFTVDGDIVKPDANFEFTDTIHTSLQDNSAEIFNSYGKGYLLFNHSNGLGFLIPKDGHNDELEYLDIPDVELFDLSSPCLSLNEADSTIYFSDDKGVYAYRTDPDFHMLREDSKRQRYSFNAVIRDVHIKDSLLFAGNHTDRDGNFTLTQPSENIPTIEYSMGDLTFGFSATCYEQEAKTQFSFYLDGVSDSWSEWSTNHTTNFTNLFEGRYTFRVKARNIHGKESSVAEYSFVILPPFYRSVWAYLLYTALLGLIIYEAMIIYGKRLKRENERLEQLVDERTDIIRKRDNEILSNIKYASYIQNAALTPKDKIAIIFPEHFIMYRPHSIVSGDFYLVTSFGTKKICIVGDCTGHGVSGGFLSMLGMSFFRQIVTSTQVPSEILHEMRCHIIENLHQGEETTNNQDGMDASVYVIDSVANHLEFAGANSRLVIVHEGKLVELKGDKMPVSAHFAHGQDDIYTNNSFDLSPGDMVYTFSDGYIDQFGGPDYKKFKMSRFRDLLVSIADKPLSEQSEIVNRTFDEFKGNNPQTDDVVVMGVRI